MESSRLQIISDRLSEFGNSGSRFLYVDTVGQKLLACEGSSVIARFDASTSFRGLGNREGSNKTPTGFHRIAAMIGNGAPAARIFKERVDTGIDYTPGMTEDNLILSRILRLEGLEQGLNKGPGIDSFDRYIYIHGTNQESRIGTPLSHGCVCLRTADTIRLFDMVTKGTIVFIDARPVSINGTSVSHIHFTGIFGSGMSALAQYCAWQGTMVSGSDRLSASSDTAGVSTSLSTLGCTLFSQDGRGITPSTDMVCVSTAIEESNPDVAAARTRNIPIVHRSDVLAAIMATKKSIAVAGTSGKSTTTAMIFEFLTACKKSPSLISGAGLRRLENEGLIGNAWYGTSDLLVVEADESDGTLVKYAPAVGVILNISRDHKSVEEVTALFATFASRSLHTIANGDDRGLDSIVASERFGTDASATWRPEKIDCLVDRTVVTRRNRRYALPLPGAHNAENLCAALCVCEHLGCDAALLADAVAHYQGVARRFAVTRTVGNIVVIDDFAHNPAKIAAAVGAARGIARRIVAIYQPHGFGPTRFLKNDYCATFSKVFLPHDTLYLLPIYYAGGTAQKDISSNDLIAGMGEVPFVAKALADREELLAAITRDAKTGDCVLLMGARDPSLPALAQKIITLFGGPVKQPIPQV